VCSLGFVVGFSMFLGGVCNCGFVEVGGGGCLSSSHRMFTACFRNYWFKNIWGRDTGVDGGTVSHNDV
jgi:hypothetical protein